MMMLHYIKFVFQITPKERQSAETFYLSKIGAEICSVSADEETTLMAHHPRYQELCEIYGEPIIKRATASSVHPDSLAAGMVRCTLQMENNGSDSPEDMETVERDVPRRFTVSNLLSIVGKAFGIDRPGLLELQAELESERRILKPATRPIGMFLEGSSAKILVRWDKERVEQCTQLKSSTASNSVDPRLV